MDRWRYRLAGAVYLRDRPGPFVHASQATNAADVTCVWCVQCNRWRQVVYTLGDAVVCARCHTVAAVVGEQVTA